MWLGELTAMTIAVDLGRKATKQTKYVTYHRYSPGFKGVLESVLQWHVFDRGASYFVE